MKAQLAERLLAKVMGWSAQDVARERARLEAFARWKYDGYEQFAPGEHFAERLARWLEQFHTPEERQTAYLFVKERLLFVSLGEIYHLIEMAFHDVVRPMLLASVARSIGCPPWAVARAANSAEYERRRKGLLVLGLSDGARLDVFRRAASPELSHEQIIAMYQVAERRADEAVEHLRHRLSEGGLTGSRDARFRTILLLDDFAGSGRSFIRREVDGSWKGKLPKFLGEVMEGPLATTTDREALDVIVVHYLAGPKAIGEIPEKVQQMGLPTGISVSLRFVQRFPESVALFPGKDAQLDQLLEAYYDPEVEDEHTRIGGTDVRYGFAGCGLPLVLSQNTPNNAVGILWAETDSVRALFPRISRHQAQSSEVV